MEKSNSSNVMLMVIGAFKIIKGLSLILMGFAVLKLVHHDVVDTVTLWVAKVHIDPDNRYFQSVVSKLVAVDDRKLKEIGAGTFFYAALFLTEGIGLILKQAWAEYFTIMVTGSFLPIEVSLLFHHFTAPRVLALLLNLGILWYLVAHRLRERRKTAKASMPIAESAGA